MSNNKLSSYDIILPFVNGRNLDLHLLHDPLGISKYEIHKFNLRVYDVPETETVVTVKLSEREIASPVKFNDYYGFGKSIKDAIERAEKLMEEYSDFPLDKLKISVTTTISFSTKFHDSKKAPFYIGTVSAFTIPHGWFTSDNMEYENNLVEQTPKDLIFNIWNNGESSENHQILKGIVQGMIDNDEMKELRKK